MLQQTLVTSVIVVNSYLFKRNKEVQNIKEEEEEEEEEERRKI